MEIIKGKSITSEVGLIKTSPSTVINDYSKLMRSGTHVN